MIFEETSLPGEETSVGEYLQPDLFILDFWQRRQIFLRYGRPTTKKVLQ